MRAGIASAAVLLIVGSNVALSQSGNLPAESSMRMELHGCTAAESGAVQKPAYDLDQFPSDLPIDQISKIAQSAVSEATGATRSAKDAEIYKKISPAVVLVAGGLGPQLVPIPTQHVDIDAVSVHRPKSPVAGLRLEISVVVGRSK